MMHRKFLLLVASFFVILPAFAPGEDTPDNFNSSLTLATYNPDGDGSGGNGTPFSAAELGGIIAGSAALAGGLAYLAFRKRAKIRKALVAAKNGVVSGVSAAASAGRATLRWTAAPFKAAATKYTSSRERFSAWNDERRLKKSKSKEADLKKKLAATEQLIAMFTAKVAQRKAETAAAVKIQSIVRMRQARKRVRAMRTEQAVDTPRIDGSVPGGDAPAPETRKALPAGVKAQILAAAQLAKKTPPADSAGEDSPRAASGAGGLPVPPPVHATPAVVPDTPHEDVIAAPKRKIPASSLLSALRLTKQQKESGSSSAAPDHVGPEARDGVEPGSLPPRPVVAPKAPESSGEPTILRTTPGGILLADNLVDTDAQREKKAALNKKRAARSRSTEAPKPTRDRPESSATEPTTKEQLDAKLARRKASRRTAADDEADPLSAEARTAEGVVEEAPVHPATSPVVAEPAAPKPPVAAVKPPDREHPDEDASAVGQKPREPLSAEARARARSGILAAARTLQTQPPAALPVAKLPVSAPAPDSTRRPGSGEPDAPVTASIPKVRPTLTQLRISETGGSGSDRSEAFKSHAEQARTEGVVNAPPAAAARGAFAHSAQQIKPASARSSHDSARSGASGSQSARFREKGVFAVAYKGTASQPAFDHGSLSSRSETPSSSPRSVAPKKVVAKKSVGSALSTTRSARSMSSASMSSDSPRSVGSLSARSQTVSGTEGFMRETASSKQKLVEPRRTAGARGVHSARH